MVIDLVIATINITTMSSGFTVVIVVIVKLCSEHYDHHLYNHRFTWIMAEETKICGITYV